MSILSADGISVLVSAYYKNTAIELDRCLASLANQNLQPNEVVVVFDGPVLDDLYSVIGGYRTSLRINLIELKKNMGLGYALNTGLARCSYKYVARIDVDDICKKNRFLLQSDFLNSYPNVDIVGGQMELFDDGGVYGVKLVPESADQIFRYSLLRNPVNHSTVMFKRDKVLNVGGYPNVRYTQDYLLWIDCLSQGLVISNLSEVLVEMFADKNMFQRRGLSYYIYDVKPYFKNYKLKNNGFAYLCFALAARFVFNVFNSIRSTAISKI